MRDREAERVAGETRTLLDHIIEMLPRVRKKLRDWPADGYPAGAGESSVGSDRHSDPVARAVVATEITRQNDKGVEVHAGWRDIDPFGARRAQLDKNLAELRKRAHDLYAELAELDHTRAGEDVPGCALCIDVLQARHPNGWQRIHSRKAPKPPAEDIEQVVDRARCSFHFEFAERYGVDAHPAIAQWHLDHLGERIPHHLLRVHHAAEFARQHSRTRSPSS